MPREVAADALDLAAWIRPGDTILWGQANAEPLPLTRALAAQRHAVGGRFRVFLGMSHADTFGPEHADAIDFLAYGGNGRNRSLAKAGVLDVLPCHYSQLPEMIATGALRIDVLLLQVAPPDERGRYSLSIAHEYLLPAIDTARVVIAEVNELAPWTHGERELTGDDIDGIVRTSRPPLESSRAEPGDVELAIGRHAAGVIEDGAVLQLGLGAIPEAVLAQLSGHRDLGVHSGAIVDGVADLVEAGVITNARKARDTGISIGGLMIGSRRIHEFAHRNPSVRFRSTAYTHDPNVLASLDRFTAINSAIEVDLTGQINAEVAGGVYVGAVGGAMDFLRGAHRAKGGLPIVALPSRAGEASRIVATLGGPVSTPRADAGLIVTEYGVADLRGCTVRERVQRMIAIAHPEHREALERAAHDAVRPFPSK